MFPAIQNDFNCEEKYEDYKKNFLGLSTGIYTENYEHLGYPQGVNYLWINGYRYMDRVWKGCVNVDKKALKSSINGVEGVFHNFVHLSTFASTMGVDRHSYHHIYQQYVDNFIHRGV